MAVDDRRAAPDGLEDNVREAVSLLTAIQSQRLLVPPVGQIERRSGQAAATALVEVTLRRLLRGLSGAHEQVDAARSE